MEFQCFEIQIKTEADSNECPHDDKPSTGMFAVSDDIFSALSSQFDDQKEQVEMVWTC